MSETKSKLATTMQCPEAQNRTRNSLQQWSVATIRNNISYNSPNGDEEWVAETLLRLIDLEKANLAQNIGSKKQTKTSKTKKTSSP